MSAELVDECVRIVTLLDSLTQPIITALTTNNYVSRYKFI